MKNSKIMNGVNVDDLSSTIEAINGDSDIARFKFNVTNEWIDGGHNQTTIKEFYGARQQQLRNETFVVQADTPPLMMGHDKGATPSEYALSALVSCLTTTLVYHAANRGIRLETVESTVEGDMDLHGLLGLDENVRNGFEGVRVTFKIKADVPEEELDQICKLGPTFSPVFDMFTNKVPVSVHMENNGKTQKVMPS